jgi:predicted DNA-binding antitoxin AbrB/MazE fold protein
MKMRRLYKGVVEGDIIKLLESVDLPKGTEALVSISPLKKAEEREIQKRELEFLEKGFDMGSVLYVRREELYDS